VLDDEIYYDDNCYGLPEVFEAVKRTGIPGI
jgi:hypothetical protein